MPRSDQEHPPIPRHPRRRRAVALLGLPMFLLVAQLSCSSLWQNVRERERMFAVDAGRNQIQRGQCNSGLDSLDRAQAKLDLGVYARESTLARARCYEKLELSQLAKSQRTLISDFYTSEPMAFPNADGSSIFRVQSLHSGSYEPPPSGLKIPQPRYSPYAQRSRIVGRVVIAFELQSKGEPNNIRVLEMPHPLLATWAIEAITQAKTRSGANIVLLPGGPYVTTFIFESRWVTRASGE
jgi:hypothetical protein